MANTPTSANELKSYFETGDIPTQDQYSDLISSFPNIIDTVSAISNGNYQNDYRYNNSDLPINYIVSNGDLFSFNFPNFGSPFNTSQLVLIYKTAQNCDITWNNRYLGINKALPAQFNVDNYYLLRLTPFQANTYVIVDVIGVYSLNGYSNYISADASGLQANATVIKHNNVIVNSAITNNSSIKLPLLQVGEVYNIFNTSGYTIDLFTDGTQSFWGRNTDASIIMPLASQFQVTCIDSAVLFVQGFDSMGNNLNLPMVFNDTNSLDISVFGCVNYSIVNLSSNIDISCSNNLQPDGSPLTISIRNSGVTKAINWDSNFIGGDLNLPNNIGANKFLTMQFIFSFAINKYLLLYTNHS